MPSKKSDLNSDKEKKPQGIRSHRSKEKREYDRRQVYKLKLKGYTNVQIAKELGVDEKTVRNDAQGITGRLTKMLDRDLKTTKAETLATLDTAIELSLASFLDSCEDQVTTVDEVLESVGDRLGRNKETKKSTKTRNQHGDARHISNLEKMLRFRSDLLGLTEVEKGEPSIIDRLTDMLRSGKDET